MKIEVTLLKPRGRTTQEALAELQRELDVRKRCFSRWVSDGKVAEVDAIDRYERLWTAHALLNEFQQRQQDQETAS